VGSVFFGKKKGATEKSATPLIAAPMPAGPIPGAGAITVPGTLVLALVFLTAFVLYYFINWKYLAATWGLS
jgi:cytochrome c oxidase subunit 1